MQQTQKTKQKRVRRVILLGLLLGGLQVLLLGLAALEARLAPPPLEWWWLLVGPLLSLLLPALAGFLASRQPGVAESPVDEGDPGDRGLLFSAVSLANAESPEGQGCLVGGIGALIPITALVVITVLDVPIASPQSSCSSTVGFCRPQLPDLTGFVVIFIGIWTVIDGVFGGLLGGWIGGLLGKGRTSTSNQRSEPTAGGSP